MTITLILIIIVIIFAAVAAALIIQAQEEAEKNETSAKEEFVGICKSAIETASQKETRKEQALALLRSRGQLSNAEIRKELGVSSRTAVRYLDELEAEGKIEQVGRTYDSLHQRLHNHLRGLSSFVRKFLKGKKEKLRKGYTFKYLVVENKRKCALLEALTTGRSCPKRIG